MRLHPDFYKVFQPRSNIKTYVHFQNPDQAKHLFEIFGEAYMIEPGPEMKAHYMSYPYMYIADHTIEGCGSRYTRVYQYDEFISVCCTESVQIDIELVSSLL